MLNKLIGMRLEVGEFIYTITNAYEGGGGVYFDADRYSQATGKIGKVKALHESTFFEIKNGPNGQIYKKPLFREV